MTLAVGGTLTTNSVTHRDFTVFSDADLICGRMTTDGHYILALDSNVNIYTFLFSLYADFAEGEFIQSRMGCI